MIRPRARQSRWSCSTEALTPAFGQISSPRLSLEPDLETRSVQDCSLKRELSLGGALMPDSNRHSLRPQIVDIPNFRDIGGIAVADGRRIRSGILLRSAALAGATPAGLERLREGGLTHVVDLRTDEEISTRPDPHLEGVTQHHLDVYGTTKAEGVANLSDLATNTSLAMASMLSAYRNMVALPSAHKAYRRFLELALRGEPLVFHCTEGKDRTGWGANLLLTLLTASEDEIQADYLQSNTGLIEQNAAFRKQIIASTPDISRAVMDIYLGVEPAYLQAARDEADRRFGSLLGYITEALGFDAASVKELRRVYLTD